MSPQKPMALSEKCKLRRIAAKKETAGIGGSSRGADAYFRVARAFGSTRRASERHIG